MKPPILLAVVLVLAVLIFTANVGEASLWLADNDDGRRA